MDNPTSSNHFYNAVLKLFTHLEQIYFLKAQATGKKKSPIFQHFINYENFFKLGGDEEIAVIYHHFEQLYDNFKDYILADNFSWLTLKEGAIILKIPDEDDKYLNLSSFVRVAESLETISNGQVQVQLKSHSKELVDGIGLYLCKIFYSITLKRQPNIIPEAEKEFKKDQLILLKKITPKPVNNASSDPANILSGLLKGIDIQKSLNGGGELSGVVSKLTNNANQVLSDMNVDVRIPDAIKTKITGLASQVNSSLSSDPSPENLVAIAKQALGPKMIIEEVDVTIEGENGEIKKLTHEEKKDNKEEKKEDKEEIKDGKDEKREEIRRRRRG